MITSQKKQQGIVLFFSLIVLVLMTIIGVALAVNSTQSLRMAGAGSERIEAMASAKGAQDKVISANAGSTMATMTVETTSLDGALGVSNTITPMNAGDVSCQRSATASSGNLISCRRVEVSSAATFGRSDMGLVTVVAGIEQEVLTGS
ncbi:pilus assembly protein PilX [Shewanella inventionis]|uniref:Pilus assembly protein PilX n=1 Tax=Shewanella inventionis TaxID=1738770 RepID=A0ABQ1J4V1_9GAMM|nr:PilX N-terminal domain-containing pilus assembly protein [Shewanella inventionis]MCL1157915.1 PilX N-terminal domain-containing pilus assembly protein [Shewanella inventionis]UAL42687.1 pilus assembly protein PilX [Shewanella inventionis]GGB60140.1 pilus assembly protein PilX [Shewanella inventionis]